MTKTKMILLGSFLLAFAAGTALGLLVSRPDRPAHGRSPLAELNLTPAQREQMKKIWTETHGAASKPQGEARSAAAQRREQAIQALLSDEQKARYDAIQQEYSRKLEELSQERKKASDAAVERCKRLMSPEQAAKYDELIKKQRERGGGMFGPRRRQTSSSSQPAAVEQPTSRGQL